MMYSFGLYNLVKFETRAELKRSGTMKDAPEKFRLAHQRRRSELFIYNREDAQFDESREI
jgi:hypothetical protein